MLRRPGPAVEPATPVAASPYGRHVPLAGIALVVVQLAGLAVAVGRSFFKEEDFLLVVRATEQDLGLGYLFQPYEGGLMPGGLAVAWAVARLSAYGWGLVTAVVLAGQAAAALAVLRMLVVAFGRRPAVLVPFALYLCWPLALPALTSWSAAVQLVFWQAAAALAITSYLLWARRPTRGRATAAVGWLVVSGAFHGAAVLIPLLVLAVHAVLPPPYRYEPVRAAVRAVVRGAPVFWVVYGGAAALLAAVHASAMLVARGLALPAAGDALAFLGRLLGETVPTTLVGGPFRWYFARPDHGVALPHPAVTAVAWLVIVAVVLASVRVRGRRPPGLAWSLLAGFLLFAVAAPALLWSVASVGPFLGTETRLAAVATPVAALCLALAFLPLRDERVAAAPEVGSEVGSEGVPDAPSGADPDDEAPADAEHAGAERGAEDQAGADPQGEQAAPGAARPGSGGRVGVPLRVAGGVLAVAVVAASLWSSYGFLDRLRTDHVRAYLATAAEELERTPSSTQIFPTPVPRELMSAWFGDARLTSRVLAPLAPPDLRAVMRDPGPSAAPVVFDDTGRLRPLDVHPIAVSRPPAAGCWPMTGGTIGGYIDILLPQDLPRRTYTIALSYTTAQPALAVLSYGGERVRLSLDAGSGARYLQVTGGGSAVRIGEITSGVGLCVSSLRMGAPIVRD